MKVVEGRQTVQEDDVVVACFLDEIHIHLIRLEQFDSFCKLVFFPHGYPDVRIQNVGSGHGFICIACNGDFSAGFFSERFRHFNDVLIREKLLRRTDSYVHADFCAADEQAVGDIVPAVADIGELDAFYASRMFFHSHKVRKHLRRMP